MPKKSWWESPFWKAVGALAALATIIGFLLQIVGAVDVYTLLILPIVNFFTIPVPLFSIPLAFLLGLAILFIIALIGGSRTSISDPLAGAEFLDDECARQTALLCRTPRTPESLKRIYSELKERYGGYDYEYCLKNLEVMV